MRPVNEHSLQASNIRLIISSISNVHTTNIEAFQCPPTSKDQVLRFLDLEVDLTIDKVMWTSSCGAGFVG